MGKWLDETFVRLDFDNLWTNYSDTQYYLVTLSQRDISVLVSTLRLSHWSTRWTDSAGKLLRDIGRLSDLEDALTYAEGLQGKLIMANTFDDLITALNGIASAVRGSACCAPGNGTQYVSDGSGGVWYGSEDPLDKPTTFGGAEDEFATEGEFIAHLCDAANNIVSGMIISLNNWSILSAVSVMAGVVVAAVFVATPPVAVFIALLVAAGSFVVTGNMANNISGNRSAWVCAIYNAVGYSDMLVRVDDLIDQMVIDLDIGPLELSVTDLIHSMLSTDIINTAYSAFGYPSPIDPVDCGECIQAACIEGITALEGTIDSLTDNQDGTWTMVITSEYNGGLDQERINIESTYEVNGCTFGIASMSKVSGPTCTRAGRYTRPDDTTQNIGDLPWNPEPDIDPIKKFEYWQSGSCSPGTSVYNILLIESA